jgi:ABC-2 type transport system permease protein
MFGQTLTIARNTFIEALRQPIFFILVMLSGLFQVFNVMLSAYSMGYTEAEREVSGDDKLLLDMGLATVLVCATLLAAFIATSALSREIENKTALTVISKPISRPTFVLGKYAGLSAAIMVALVSMLVFFLFGIRHEVLETVRDQVDGPVLIFGSLAVALSIGMAVWGNFFYGWVFPSTASLLLAPLLVLAYAVTLVVSKDWSWQAPGATFKPEIMKASGCVALAMLTLSAVAVAASTRLGQVMTITVCAGVFMLGLVSNYLLGQHAFQNSPAGMIASVEMDEETTLTRDGDRATITLEAPIRADVGVGAPLYYGPNPSGVRLAVPPGSSFTPEQLGADLPPDPARPSGLVIAEIDDQREVFGLVNENRHPIARPPLEGDYVFERPTRHNWLALTIWSVVPNVQSFWLVDAITQGHRITGRYLTLLAGYTLTQVVGLLALAVLLFQRREVG